MAYPPALEFVAFTLRLGHFVQLSADRRPACHAFRIFVVQIKVHHVLRRARVLHPVRVQRRVPRDDIRSEDERLRVLRIRIPADKRISVLHALFRTRERFAVDHSHRRYLAPTVLFKLHPIRSAL